MTVASFLHRRLGVVALAVMAGCGEYAPTPAAPHIVTSDVHNFVAALDQLDPADTACAPLAEVFAKASPGMRAYSGKFDVDQRALCRALRRNPARYAALRERLPSLDSIADSAGRAFVRFRALYPEARFTPVYFIPGNGISGGTTTNGRAPVILIGAELIGSTARLPRTIVHELVHVQQHYPFWGTMTGGPAFLRGSLLRQAITEGSADFLMELVFPPEPPGSRRAWFDAHEAQMRESFWRDRHAKDYRDWLYNGWNRAALGDRPPDLGYEVGYRITKAYYERATDKRQAVYDILHIRDFDRFLAASGY